MNPVVIRPETMSDIEAIRHLTDRAFAKDGKETSPESAVVDGLRSAGALTRSLVAIPASSTAKSGTPNQDTISPGILGHAAFSPITIDGQEREYYALGPISVQPSAQHQGIGTALVHEGIKQMRRLGAKGVVLLGNPAFYIRLGFRHSDRLWYAGAPKDNFMVFQLSDDRASGEVHFHEAFAVTGSH